MNHLVAFDPSTGTRTRELVSRRAFLPRVAPAPDGTLWLADRGLPNPGIRVRRRHRPPTSPRSGIDVGLPRSR
ncbi:MAG: hypothetical protein U0807_13115 [Candidatus Binatia bacterium]